MSANIQIVIVDGMVDRVVVTDDTGKEMYVHRVEVSDYSVSDNDRKEAPDMVHTDDAGDDYYNYTL